METFCGKHRIQISCFIALYKNQPENIEITQKDKHLFLIIEKFKVFEVLRNIFDEGGNLFKFLQKKS